jgi:hypothetical protein
MGEQAVRHGDVDISSDAARLRIHDSRQNPYHGCEAPTKQGYTSSDSLKSERKPIRRTCQPP